MSNPVQSPSSQLQVDTDKADAVAMREISDALIDIINAIQFFSTQIASKGGKSIRVNFANAVVLPGRTEKDQQVQGTDFIVNRSDLTALRKEWNGMLKTAIRNLVALAKSRRKSVNILSGFNNPRRFTQVITNFIAGASSLDPLTKNNRLDNLVTNRVSTQGIMTSLITSIAYDPNANRPSLVYYANRNRTNIQVYLKELARQNGGSLPSVNNPEADQILNSFYQGQMPAASSVDVTAALNMAGINKNTRIDANTTGLMMEPKDVKTIITYQKLQGENKFVRDANNNKVESSRSNVIKVINGQYIGVDPYMNDNLASSLKVITDKGTNISNMKFSDLQRLTSDNFEPDQVFPIIAAPGSGATKDEKALVSYVKTEYVKLAKPYFKEFHDAHNLAKNEIKKKKPGIPPNSQLQPNAPIQNRKAAWYQYVVNRFYDFSNLANDVQRIAQTAGQDPSNALTHLQLLTEAENVKLFRLAALAGQNYR